MSPNQFRATRVALCTASWLLIQAPVIAAQSPSPVTAAFRATVQDLAERIGLAAEAMPAERYTFRAPPAQRSFGEIVHQLGQMTDYLCSRLARTPHPRRSDLSPTSRKDTLVARISEAFGFCDQAMATVADSALADSVRIELRYNALAPEPRMPRAQGLMIATAYWADTYAQLANALRLVGRVPPEMCRGAARANWNLNPLCDSGVNLCNDVGGGRGGYAFTLGDSPYSVRSDGRGPYRAGANVLLVAAARPAVIVFGAPAADSTPRRSIRVDITRPVPGDIGVPLGIVLADHDIEVAAQWYTEGDYTSHSILEIPVGSTVQAAQVDVAFPVDGKAHVLQMGPQPYGHCYSDGTAIHGHGTSTGTIQRETEDRWIVDVPTGSIGRLFDNHLGNPSAVNKGLYYVSLHFVLDK